MQPLVRRVRVAVLTGLVTVALLFGGAVAALGHSGSICYHGNYYNSWGWNEIYEGSYNLYGIHYHKYRHYHSYGSYPTHWEHKACSSGGH